MENLKIKEDIIEFAQKNTVENFDINEAKKFCEKEIKKK